ncbi:hypothetical protein Bbelb_108570 [Branchiostoma belcheri]|nr:hypothetical protein Bbelb_108570 [Branchiostoma belcheri]
MVSGKARRPSRACRPSLYRASGGGHRVCAHLASTRLREAAIACFGRRTSRVSAPSLYQASGGGHRVRVHLASTRLREADIAFSTRLREAAIACVWSEPLPGFGRRTSRAFAPSIYQASGGGHRVCLHLVSTRLREAAIACVCT